MRRIAVIGMGRSGTTFLTEFLSKCGVFLDNVNWVYEHELVRLINDSILAQQFGAVEDWLPYGKLPKQEIELSEYWHQMAVYSSNTWIGKHNWMVIMHIEHLKTLELQSCTGFG
jgi:hypothetical protein